MAGEQALGFAATLELDELDELLDFELLELEDELLLLELLKLELLELVLELLEDERLDDELDFELLEFDELELDLELLELRPEELSEELVFELELTGLDELKTTLEAAELATMTTEAAELLVATELDVAIEELATELITLDCEDDELAGGTSPSCVDTEDATLATELWAATELATIEETVKGLGDGELAVSPPPAPPPQALKSMPDKAKAANLTPSLLKSRLLKTYALKI